MPKIKIRIPASLSHLTDGKRVVECSANNISECLKVLDEEFPGIKNRINEDHINIFVNGDNIKYLQGLETILKEGDELDIIPAVAGG